MDGISLVGRITTLNTERGFGFVRCDGVMRKDHFFHVTALPNRAAFDALEPGQAVAFISVETPKGYRAEAIELLGDGA